MPNWSGRGCFQKGNVPATRGMQTGNPDNYRVDEDGCWLWQGALKGAIGTEGAYPYMRVPGPRGTTSTTPAHRWHYERMHGAIPRGHHVHHRCGVTRCVNPDHLEALSPRDHARISSKLTEEKAREIRYLASQGVAHREIARRYGVDHRTVGGVVRGERWRPAPQLRSFADDLECARPPQVAV